MLPDPCAAEDLHPRVSRVCGLGPGRTLGLGCMGGTSALTQVLYDAAASSAPPAAGKLVQAYAREFVPAGRTCLALPTTSTTCLAQTASRRDRPPPAAAGGPADLGDVAQVPRRRARVATRAGRLRARAASVKLRMRSPGGVAGINDEPGGRIDQARTDVPASDARARSSGSARGASGVRRWTAARRAAPRNANHLFYRPATAPQFVVSTLWTNATFGCATQHEDRTWSIKPCSTARQFERVWVIVFFFRELCFKI